MPNDKYDFGKHYYILDKKLENHINAKNNPHNITSKDIGLENIEDLPLDHELNIESDNYISNKAVTTAMLELNAALADKQDKLEVFPDGGEATIELKALRIDDVVYSVQPLLDSYVSPSSNKPVQSRGIYNFVIDCIDNIDVNTLLRSVQGYDSSKTQTLKNINGTFTWVDDE